MTKQKTIDIYKESILKYLKQCGVPVPSTKISVELARNYYIIQKVLEALLKDKLIKKIQMNSSTYWELNDKNK